MKYLKQQNFIDRKPQEKPVMGHDGRLYHPAFVQPGQPTNPPPKAIKAYGAFTPAA